MGIFLLVIHQAQGRHTRIFPTLSMGSLVGLRPRPKVRGGDTTSMLPTIALMVSGIQMLPVPPVRPFQRHARRSLVTFVAGTLVGTLTTNAVWTTLSRSADGVRKRTARSCATAALVHSHASVSRTGTMSRRSA